MKSPPTSTDDCDDIFGPPRTYATGYYPPKTRPSMISAKYRQKEERRKVLKISINKLKKIEDPEASLCRSVLINNTMKRLQKEARDEKIQKQQLNYPRCYDNDNFLNLKSEFIKNELKNSSNYEEPRSFTPIDSKIVDGLKADFANENDFDSKISDDISVLNNDSVKSMVINGLVDESLNGYSTNNNVINVDQIEDNERFSYRKRLFDDIEECSVQEIFQKSMIMNGLVDESMNNFGTNNNVSVEPIEDNGRFASRKRSFDDMEDCDVQEVLSQFYMPPTPRMLTCIDDDEDVNVVDDEPMPKRAKNDISDLVPPTQISIIQNDLNSPNQNSESLATRLDTMELLVTDKKDYRVNSYINNNIPETDSRLRFVPSTQNMDSDANSFSCGHASMFSELQTNVFHSLIASLET